MENRLNRNVLLISCLKLPSVGLAATAKNSSPVHQMVISDSKNGVRNTTHNAKADRQKQRIMAVSHQNNPEVGREADDLNEDESGETIR